MRQKRSCSQPQVLTFHRGATLAEACSVTKADGRTKIVIDAEREVGPIARTEGKILKVNLKIPGEGAPAEPLDLEVSGRGAGEDDHGGQRRNVEVSLESEAARCCTRRPSS